MYNSVPKIDQLRYFDEKALSICAVICGRYFCFRRHSGCGDTPQQTPNSKLHRLVITVQPESLELSTQLPGRTGVSRREVRPQVSGVLLERTFEEGTVEKGQQLYKLIQPLMKRSWPVPKQSTAGKSGLRSSELR